MKLMEDRIMKDGSVLPGGILKVGNFLNQQIDPMLLKEIGEEIARLFENEGVTKILTIESSGIAIGAAAGMAMGVPMVFAKKHKTSNVDGYVYSTVVHSFTHGIDYDVFVSCDYLNEGEKVLIVDDFLSNGNAIMGLLDLVEQAGAESVGVAVCIEKEFQGGGDIIRKKGIRLESLAIVSELSEGRIKLKEQKG